MDNVNHLLLRCAQLEPSPRLIFYGLGNKTRPETLSCRELLAQATRNGRVLQALPNFRHHHPVAVYLDDHEDAIVWFWSVLLAQGVPVLLPRLSGIDHHRRQHLEHLSVLLQSPVCITRQESLPLFDGSHDLCIHTVESLARHSPNEQLHEKGRFNSLAFLMLTSGSIGNSKAVRLTHVQVLSAIAGKASVRSIPAGQPFLNWIGLDHVASLVEIHLQALWLGVDQVHVHAADVVSSPVTFLDLIQRHRICRTFAPNFFLKKVVAAVSVDRLPVSGASWDLSCLAVLATGGEMNDIKTCVAASRLLEDMGAPRHVITPGFGMTETCAGAIFNLDCPDYDVASGRAVASLGKCMRGIEMRVAAASVESPLSGAQNSGELQIRGTVVTDGYYGDPEATAAAFTPDGWFRTGDLAMVDSNGNLCLLGRTKDVINVNGVKLAADDLQSSLEQTLGDRIARVICFPSQHEGDGSEGIMIAYTPRAWPLSLAARADIDNLVFQTIMASSGCQARVFAITQGSQGLLPTSTLGKISRAKMQALFERGLFNNDYKLHQSLMQQLRDVSGSNLDCVASKDEQSLIDDFAITLDAGAVTIGVHMSLFELGFTSTDLIRLKKRIDTRLGITLPVISLIKNPTARSLAAFLKDQRASAVGQAAFEATYEPVVTLRPNGNKAPLWLIHPGVGEVLVFVGLAQQLADRPVHALRARGFEPGQAGFGSISEITETYVVAIRRRQPRGPYALAGYSYGTMLAFEMAKRLEAEDGPGAVRFLGSFNLPPHIKQRMLQLDWTACLLHLTYFLGLTTAAYADDVDLAHLRSLSREKVLDTMLNVADAGRLHELGLGRDHLARWADVAYGLQRLAVDYEPQGTVDAIDVFHAEPLQVAASSRQDWIDNHLSKWKDFCRTAPRFHEVGGAHYTMIGPDHVVDFASKLTAALLERGLG
ncbi:hypothetical protein HIM_10847 [Hirsutella minnesotensis 3608]|uniref:Carrier domain-containing protein n=1 Tax=Hirsutella minnesotensis 3608 TaxID=1043627 RepID=A0A0F8A1V9_9HYPO|nr:hypothetical protein HIM_10847 [Hirsutella minnesotensis 3608]